MSENYAEKIVYRTNKPIERLFFIYNAIQSVISLSSHKYMYSKSLHLWIEVTASVSNATLFSAKRYASHLISSFHVKDGLQMNNQTDSHEISNDLFSPVGIFRIMMKGGLNQW